MAQLNITMKELLIVLQDDMDVTFLDERGNELYSGHTPFEEIPEVLADKKGDHIKMDFASHKLIVYCK
jgi:hypothetical protein